MTDGPQPHQPRVLLADDEVALRESLVEVLKDEGMAVTATGRGDEALELLKQGNFDLLITDINMPGLDGMSLLREAQAHCPRLSVMLITAYGTMESAIEAIRFGASDYILKPMLLDDLILKARRVLQVRELKTENRRLRAEVDHQKTQRTIIGDSSAVRQMMTLIDKVASTRSSVLIVGESGTGKELVARAIHDRGVTAEGPFVPVNCGGIPDTLFESEMFGHRRGSFTGAIRDKVGFFEAANGGTLFLDEIGNLPLGAQMSLLRAIEEKAIQRVGDTRQITIEMRIITATNIDPSQLVAENKFREDLYFRLNVVQVGLEPLRRRKEDIPLLVRHFINKYNIEMNRQCPGMSDEAMTLLQGHPWKGNIRELENVIERALIFAEDREIEPDDLPFQHPAGAQAPHMRDSDLSPSEAGGTDWPDSLDKAGKIFEAAHIGRLLKQHGYDKSQTAQFLGISVPSLYRKIHDLKLPMRED